MQLYVRGLGGSCTAHLVGDSDTVLHLKQQVEVRPMQQHARITCTTSIPQAHTVKATLPTAPLHAQQLSSRCLCALGQVHEAIAGTC